MRVSVLALMMAILLANGCAATLWAGKRSTTLSVGMTKRQAQARFGSPQHIMSQELNGVMIETWRYLDRSLTFHDGRLQVWSLAEGAAVGAPDGSGSR